PVINRLDPVAEHRTYCPWTNAQSQSRNPVPVEGDLPGWETLRDMVLRIRPPVGLRVQGAVEGAGAVDPGDVGTGADLGEEAGERSKEERDRERWARLKKLKQVFRVRRKPKGGEEGPKAKGR
ncbi:MAG: hypothetical protein Q9211_005967, partial [Gyalolechia sp. 1 TL-2023]